MGTNDLAASPCYARPSLHARPDHCAHGWPWSNSLLLRCLPARLCDLSIPLPAPLPQVHSANGYLLDSFLQTKSNKRTDEYSGESLEGRFRLLKEVVEAVIGAGWAPSRVGVRLSPNGAYNDQVRQEGRGGGGRLWEGGSVLRDCA